MADATQNRQVLNALSGQGNRDRYVDANEIRSAVELLVKQGMDSGSAYTAVADQLRRNQFYEPYGNEAKGFVNTNPAAEVQQINSRASSSGGGGYSDPSQGIINNALKKLTDLYSQLAAYKPASFDEALAKQSVTQQTDQYYSSRIEDFLKGVNLSISQSAESEKQTLQQLTAGKDRYLAGEAQEYDIAKNEALSNVVGTGRQLSGFGSRQLGQQEAVRNTGLTNFLAGVQERESDVKLQGKQFGERTNLQKEQQIGGYQSGNFGTLGGEYGRQRALGIEEGVANRRQEFTQEELMRQQQYNQGIQAQIGGLSSLLGGYGY